MAERSLGLTMPVAKPPAKGKEDPPNGKGTKRRRPRRPTVRALKMAKSLQATVPDGAPAEAAVLSENG